MIGVIGSSSCVAKRIKIPLVFYLWRFVVILVKTILMTSSQSVNISIRAIAVVILVSCAGAPQHDGATVHEDDDRTALYELLPQGPQQVDMMDHVTMPARTQYLMEKFQRAAEENPAWLLEAKKMVEETGQPMGYDERSGMTEAEWDEFLVLMQNRNGLVMTKSGTEEVTIRYSDDKITFENSNRLELLNRIVIDLSDFSVQFADHHLTSMKKVDVSDSNNGLGSAWSGYEWRHEESNKEMDALQAVDDYGDLSMTIKKVIVAKLEKTQQTYLHIQYTLIQDGNEIINYQMPMIIQR